MELYGKHLKIVGISTLASPPTLGDKPGDILVCLQEWPRRAVLDAERACTVPCKVPMSIRAYSKKCLHSSDWCFRGVGSGPALCKPLFKQQKYRALCSSLNINLGSGSLYTS